MTQMADSPPQVELELSDEEFDPDPSTEGVELSDVETHDNQDVDSQDPEASGGGHAS